MVAEIADKVQARSGMRVAGIRRTSTWRSGHPRRLIVNKKLIGAISAGALALSGIGGATALAASGGGSAAKMHTLKFNSITKGGHPVGRNSFAGIDVDKHKGKVIGYDTINGTFDRSTQSIKIRVAVSLNGGLLYGKLHGVGPSTDLDGVVTGGTGKYKGATGTITTHELPNGNTTQVVVKWS
jgi:hypothetical protein